MEKRRSSIEEERIRRGILEEQPSEADREDQNQLANTSS